MKRSRLERRTPLRSSGRIAPRARTKAEQDEKFEREYGGKRRADWMHEHSCLACGASPIEAAHTANGGLSKKGGPETLVPLCTAHHRELHQHGAKTFAAAHEDMLMGLSLVQWAARYERAWQRFQSQPEPLSSVVPRVVADLIEGNE